MQGRRTKDISEEYSLSMLQTLRYPKLKERNMDIKRYMDVRDDRKFARDIKIGSDNCRKAMIGYCGFLNGTGRGYAQAKIYPEEVWDNTQEQRSFKQDADLILNEDVIPFEVKVAPDGMGEDMYFRYWSIKNIGMLDGKVLIVDGQMFTVVDGNDIYVTYPVVNVEMWGGKKGFKVPKSDFEWDRFLSPVYFISHRKKKY